MTPDQLKEKIKKLSSDAEVTVRDLTGTQDHYEAIIVSTAFQGKMMIEQHRMVMDLVGPELKSGEVHALTLKTYTPEQFKNRKR